MINNMKKIDGFDTIRALKEGYIIFDEYKNAYNVIYNKIYKQDMNKNEWNETIFNIETLIYKSYYINNDIPIDKTIEIPLEQNLKIIMENTKKSKIICNYSDFIIGIPYISSTINKNEILFCDGYNIAYRAIVKNFDDLFNPINFQELKIV